MIRTIRLTAAVTAFAVGVLMLPAAAQDYSNQFSPAKLITQATTSVPIAGPGKVVIQVVVYPNGTHKVSRIILSTNPGDNAAAIDIANKSTYRPQHRGKTPVLGFYDFTLKFTGKSVVNAARGGSTSAAASTSIDAMIRAGKYAQAKSLITSALAKKPNDPVLNQQLAAANYFLGDYAAAASSFDRVSNISKTFMQVAAQSYAMAAEKLVATDATTAVSYAQKAVALAPSGGSYYALGAAEFQAGNIDSAVSDLERSRSMAMADPKTDAKSKINIDSALLQAYVKSGNTAGTDKIKAEIMQLDPKNTTVLRVIGNSYLAQGNDASKAGKHEDALAAFLQAAKQGDPQVAVTGYASAALEENTILGTQKTPAVPNDYLTKMKPYADQALAINANDPLANYALGVAMTGAWITGGKQKADFKSQALDALNKADSLAKAQGNIALSLNIERFIREQIQK